LQGIDGLYSFMDTLLPKKKLRPRLGITLGVLAALVMLTLGGCRSEYRAESIYQDALTKWDKQQYPDAAREFVSLAELYPTSPLVEESLYWAGCLYHYFIKDTAAAERLYQKLLIQFPQGNYTLEAQENLAGLYEADKTKRYRAILIYKRLVAAEGMRSRRDQIRFRLAHTYLDMGKLDQARFEFRELLKREPGSNMLPEAIYLVGFSYYLEKRFELALVAFRQVERDYPGSMMAQRARFFMADMLEEEGRMSEALRIFESLEGKYHNATVLAKRIQAIKARMSKSVR